MDIQQKINNLWNTASAEYDTRPSHGIHTPEQEHAWTDALRSMLPPPPARILEPGCGTGVVSMMLADLGYHVTGCDLSDGMLAQAQRKAEGRDTAHFLVGDAIDPPGDPASFDAIINRHVLWTLTDPPRALRNWLRLLRPGGTLAIIDGLWGRSADNRLEDAIASALPLLDPAITVEDIAALVSNAGFTNVAISTLEEVDRVEPSHDPHPQPHYVITASKAE